MVKKSSHKETIIARFFILPRRFFPTTLSLLLVTDRRMIFLSKGRGYLKKGASEPVMTQSVFNSEELDKIVEINESNYYFELGEVAEVELNTSPFREETFGYYLKITTKKKKTKWDLRFDDLEKFRETMKKLKLNYVEK
ncbi:MAG: hypothetical protein ACUVXA_09900 [Candidatus Jordarchaeum sp.]|uniref:hypothetical protein n=1 Tax=Candidatus Jordarchaeum sp. TaxID=2823881 RepID=UPI00404A2AD4